MRTKFVELRVYQMAEDLSDRVWEIVLGWNNLATDTVGEQLIRAADSIGANIAEGEGRGSHADNKRFVRIARGSLQETQHWLRRACKRKLLSKEQVDGLKPLIDQLALSLNAYFSKIGSTKGKIQKTEDQER